MQAIIKNTRFTEAQNTLAELTAAFNASIAEEARLLAALKEAVAKHGILRVKGFAAIPSKAMRLLVQGVGQRFDRHCDRAWGADEARQTRLVLIGQDLDRAAIEAELKAALA